MANRITAEDVKKAMASFYKGKINVFEAGAEDLTPERIQDRPFFKTIPEGHTSYLQKAEGKQVGSYELTVDKPAEGSKIETENSQFIEEMETRFRNVKPNATLIIIDPDVIRDRYAMDESQNKSLSDILAHYLKEKLTKNGNNFPLSPEDNEFLKGAAVDGNSPLSATQNDTKGQISIVIGTQPDMPMHDMFARPFGTVKRMEREGIDGESVRKMILYHEIGHALDLAKRGTPGRSPNTTITHGRHRTECVADAHAVLQLARDEGHTKTGELVGDLRADTVISGVTQLLPQRSKGMQMLMGQNEPLMMRISGQNQEERLAVNRLSGDIPLSFQMKQNGFNQDQQQEVDPSQFLNEAEQIANTHQKIMMIGMVAAYNTSPAIDAAVAFAKQGLADGSLKKMTDKEVHNAADKIAEMASWSQKQIDAFCFGVLTGKTDTPEIESVIDRAEVAGENQPALKISSFGFVKQYPDQISQEQIDSVIEWRKDVYEKIEKEGGNREDILKVVTAEKDKLRKEYDSSRKSDPVIELKMAVINQEFLGNSEHASNLAKVSATVKSSLQNIDVPKSNATGEELLVEFIGHEMKIFEAAEKGLGKAANRNSTASIEEIEKSRSSERRDYKKILVAERNAEVAAFRVRKDPEAWKLAQKSPELAKNITEKAKQKHPQWVDEYHLNFSNNDRFRVEKLQKVVGKTKTMFAHVVKKTEDIRIAVERNDSKLADKINKNAPAQQQQQRVTKQQPDAKKQGNIIWNKTIRNLKVKSR